MNFEVGKASNDIYASRSSSLTHHFDTSTFAKFVKRTILIGIQISKFDVSSKTMLKHLTRTKQKMRNFDKNEKSCLQQKPCMKKSKTHSKRAI